MKAGRVVSAQTERVKKASERAKAQKKQKRRSTTRVVFVTLLFVALIGVLILVGTQLAQSQSTKLVEVMEVKLEPTIEVVDEDSYATDGKISSRMSEFIGQAEQDFRDVGYTPVKAVIPSGAIRQVNFYFSEFTGYVKTTLDRDTAILAEDMERMVRYLKGIDVNDFEYIDIRVKGKAYWK